MKKLRAVMLALAVLVAAAPATAIQPFGSQQYQGVVQTVAFSATPAFNVASGETILITLTANITSWTMSAGLAGEVATIVFIQDATGGRTLAGTPGNVKLAGTFTLSTAANFVDALSLKYDSVNSVWRETGRSINAAVDGVVWPLQNGTSTDTFNSGVTMNGSAVAYSSDTTNGWTNGDKLWSWKSGGLEQLAIVRPFGYPIIQNTAGGNIGMSTSSNDFFILVPASHQLQVYFNGTSQNLNISGVTNGSTLASTNSTNTITLSDTLLTLKSGVAMAGTGVGTIVDTVNALTAGDTALAIKSAGSGLLNIGKSNANGGAYAGVPGVFGVGALGMIDAANSMIYLNNLGTIDIWPGGAHYYQFNANNWLSFVDGQSTLGKKGTRWGGLFNSKNLSASYNTQSGATYTAVIADYYIGLSNSAARTVTLYAANAVDGGTMLIIKDENGNAGTNNITINRASTDTIDGATSLVINTNKGRAVLMSDGVGKWFQIN